MIKLPLAGASREDIRRVNLEKRVVLRDGTPVAGIGQGTWNMGEDRARREEEIAALRLGVELGMDLIDTAEMYGEGRSEELVGEAIRGIRDEVFLVSKVHPQNAGGERLAASCENSLKRLGTDRLDLYLLHWRGDIPLEETVEGMERLVREGKIARWGVSNFDMADMLELEGITGTACAVNQVLYHLGSRGIETDLMPWQRSRGIPVMAYSPLAQAGALRRGMTGSEAVRQVASNHGAEPLQVLLAWSVCDDNVFAIPKASTPDHVLQNAAARLIELTEEERVLLDNAFPRPAWKVPLDMI
ncbi:aldo/keto reductase [Paenibacillus spiritus]|uniref:Aldo/keto reductase n=1 Tax=Paenibacillus spiritus TaxID=2496557 RepID=A0A5J5GBD6_9BACL|nr:aldo/keto reductase [Paenibacillus spiritus]KAA9005439.1 aldo/keto reductase [Paenibacillus spiritus]